MNGSDRRAEQIFAVAIEIDNPAERRAYLHRTCAGDAQLLSEVQSLLAAHEQAGAFLQESPTVAAGAQEVADLTTPLAEKSGHLIGRYKLLEQIGEGGFGTVWMAEQEEPVRRRVALKIIKLGMDTLLAALGLTKDSNANPVGFGILALFIFWPGLGLMISGVVQSYSRYRSARK